MQRCEELCYKYKGLGKCVLLGSLGQRIYKALARNKGVISTGTNGLGKPDQQRFQSCHGTRGGEEAPSWISAALIREIRNALSEIRMRTGSAGGGHLAQVPEWGGKALCSPHPSPQDIGVK